MTSQAALSFHRVPGPELRAGELQELLRLRASVFVVEQQAAFQEVDGRDLEPETRHLWLSRVDGELVAYLRVLAEPGGVWRIGRVCTAANARRSGLAARLMTSAMTEIGTAECVLDAQVTALELYRRFGFHIEGQEYLDEDGIPHIRMRRPARDA